MEEDPSKPLTNVIDSVIERKKNYNLLHKEKYFFLISNKLIVAFNSLFNVP